MSGRLFLAALSVLLGLVGCATRAPEAPTSVPADVPAARPPAAALSGYEQQQLGRAEAAEADGRWADAMLAWEVLGLLRPEDPAPRERLARARAQAAQAVAARRAEALAAQRRGDSDAAERAWLQLLALDPADLGAADALRQIERERNRRSQVGRFARSPLSARPVGNGTATSPAAEDAARTANSQREHATMLARQGDVDGAIAMLRSHAQWRSLPGHRALLADLYVRKAEGLKSSQPEAARAAVAEALSIDPRHAGALGLQAQLLRPAGRSSGATAPRATSP